MIPFSNDTILYFANFLESCSTSIAKIYSKILLSLIERCASFKKNNCMYRFFKKNVFIGIHIT